MHLTAADNKNFTIVRVSYCMFNSLTSFAVSMNQHDNVELAGSIVGGNVA